VHISGLLPDRASRPGWAACPHVECECPRLHRAAQAGTRLSLRCL